MISFHITYFDGGIIHGRFRNRWASALMDTQDLQKYVGEKIETISLDGNEVEITFESGEKLSILGRGGDGYQWIEARDNASRW